MPAVLCLVLLAYAPVAFLQTEVTLGKGKTWSRDFILAPGDSLRVSASYLRQLGSSCGCLGGLGDAFLRRGDNVGRVALGEWRGGIATSVYEQSAPEILYYTDKGGAFTLYVENHSAHRTNLYSMTAARTPTAAKYASFDVSFKADTSYETTWVDEPVYETYAETTWMTLPSAVTTYETTFVERTDRVTLKAFFRTSGSSSVDLDFFLPSSSTGELAYSLCSDTTTWREQTEEVQSRVKAAGTVLAGVTATPAVGVLADLLAATVNAHGATYDFTVLSVQGTYRRGNQVANAVGKLTGLPVGCMYYLRLENEALTSKPTVIVSLATRVVKAAVTDTKTEIPIPSQSRRQVGSRRVPRVGIVLTPKLPWSHK